MVTSTFAVPVVRSSWRRHVLVPVGLRPLRTWLTGRTSLTARLVAASSSFAVTLLFEGLAKPHRDEARLLGLGPGQLARVRQVCLVCDGQPAVYEEK